MTSVYQNSFITLAATSARNSYEGCFARLSPSYDIHALEELRINYQRSCTHGGNGHTVMYRTENLLTDSTTRKTTSSATRKGLSRTAHVSEGTAFYKV